MRHRVIRYLIYAQLSFFLCLAVAVFITTSGFNDNHGLSFYGEHLNTVLPFGLGFVLCDYFLLKAAAQVASVHSLFKAFENPLRVLALLTLFILLTPDTVNGFFNLAHTIDSSVLFCFEMLLSLWLALRWHSDRLTWFLLAAQLLAGSVAMLSEFQVTVYLSEGSLFFQLFFGLLLIWSLSRLIEQMPTSLSKRLAQGRALHGVR